MPQNTRGLVTSFATLALVACLLTFTEAKLRLPYTTPVIQTSHGTVVHPETGEKVPVFPVNFSFAVADCFKYPVTLVDSTVLKGDSVVRTHVFTGASLKLVFDVPNPGLDFVLNLTAADYPVVQDQYGSLWKPVSPLNLEIIKQDTKYTYDVGSVGMTSYQSQSEYLEMPVGTPQYDTECYRTKACCGLNTTNYRKYSLVDSPVPPYACTDSALTYQPPTFSFSLSGHFMTPREDQQTQCKLLATQKSTAQTSCNKNSISVNGVSAWPQYGTPSPGFLLCRQGTFLTDQTYQVSPIPVVNLGFCPTKTCIGYTASNYMSDRLGCYDYALGFYTSLDGNNSNQFSFYEDAARDQWATNFPKLTWIDDIGFSSSGTINNISFQRDVPAATGWSLSYADFALPLTDTLTPLFPIGRPTRVTARFDKVTSPTAVIVTVEYISFSNFTAANWTVQTCVGTLCAISLFPVAAESNLYPRYMNATVSLTALGYTPQLLPSQVVVTVTCESTPTANLFHTLLRASTVTVGAAILPSATKTVDASLAYKPPQNVPSPYAASLGVNATSRIICLGDYRFSTTTGGCVPLTDQECAIKYRFRRIRFNATLNECMHRAPLLTKPLVFRPLPEPIPPPVFTEESIREMMKKFRLARFMQTMEQAMESHDTKLANETASASQNTQARESAVTAQKADFQSKMTKAAAATASVATAAATAATSSNTDSSLPEEYPGFYPLSVAFLVVTAGTWVFILFRDVFYMLGGVKEWSAENREGAQRSTAQATLTTAPPTSQTPPTQPMTTPLLRPAKSCSGASTPSTRSPSRKFAVVGEEITPNKRRRNEVEMTEFVVPPPAASSAPAPPPPFNLDAIAEPFTPSTSRTYDIRPNASMPACGSTKKHKWNVKSRRSHVFPQQGQSPHPPHQSTEAPQRMAPTWDDVPLSARAPPSHPFQPQNHASEQHTPFGNTQGAFAPDDLSPRGDYTSRSSGRGAGVPHTGSTSHFVFQPDADPLLFSEDPNEMHRYGFAGTPPPPPPPPPPPRSPSARGTTRRPPGDVPESGPTMSPYSFFRVVRIMHGWNSPYTAAAAAAAGVSGASASSQSSFGADQFPIHTPVRQSSRVEVLSSDSEHEDAPQYNGLSRPWVPRTESLD